MNMRDAAYYRVTVGLGDRTRTYWSDELPQMDDSGLLSFVTLQSGEPKSVSEYTPCVITGISELPPAVGEE